MDKPSPTTSSPTTPAQFVSGSGSPQRSPPPSNANAQTFTFGAGSPERSPPPSNANAQTFTFGSSPHASPFVFGAHPLPPLPPAPPLVTEATKAAKLRPGTVDYSKFNDIDSDVEDSDPESVEKEDFDMDDAEDDEEDEEDDGESVASSTMDEDVKSKNLADLSTLQKAWSQNKKVNDTPSTAPATATATTYSTPSSSSMTTSSSRSCASCLKSNPKYRCSRCKLVSFCSTLCQTNYHPVHVNECVDASKHMAYWGIYGSDSSSTSSSAERKEKALIALNVRIRIKREKAMKKAFARNAALRAKQAREAQAASGNGKGGKDEKGAASREETCAVCQCEFTIEGDSGVGLSCPGSHFMCCECSGVYVNSVMSDLEVSYPPSCFICKVKLSIDHFSQQLTLKQTSQLKAHIAEFEMKEGEMILKCGSCDYFEIVTSAPVVWYCGFCSIGKCFVCLKGLPLFSADAKLMDGVRESHRVCSELRVAKGLVEEAIETGASMSCPGCGLEGRKDDACTHMTCPKCTQIWCYVCGVSVEDCDKSKPREGAEVNDIFLHNRGWQSNAKRCPMYLTNILDVDENWLGEGWQNQTDEGDDHFADDDKCLDYFHRWQTIKKLQETREEVGSDVFKRIYETFESVRASGYSLEEVLSTDCEELIDRSGWNEEDHEGEDGEEENFEEGEGEEGEGEDDGESVWEDEEEFNDDEWEDYDPATFGGEAVFEELYGGAGKEEGKLEG